MSTELLMDMITDAELEEGQAHAEDERFCRQRRLLLVQDKLNDVDPRAWLADALADITERRWQPDHANEQGPFGPHHRSRLPKNSAKTRTGSPIWP